MNSIIQAIQIGISPDSLKKLSLYTEEILFIALKYMIPRIVIIIVIYIIIKKWLNSKQERQTANHPEEAPKKYIPPGNQPEKKYTEIYQRNWMFTYNEKDAYAKLKAIADECNLIVFAKVRLLDLVQPKRGIDKYKTYFNKVQAKHVDFVLCDKKLVARYIIELDDSTHDRIDRQERDRFVDAVLQSVGYKVIHVRDITEKLKEELTPT